MSAVASRPKEFRFPLALRWLGGDRVAVGAEGKAALEVAPPPVFRGTDPTAWSPEDLLVASAASCLAVTFAGLASRAGLEVSGLELGGEGVVGRRDDGRFGFTALHLRLGIEVGAGDEERALELARQAESSCLVSASLDLPVETVIELRRPDVA